jgi:DeoR/GlpR family transcriptional regulator of sugar metabolism
MLQQERKEKIKQIIKEKDLHNVADLKEYFGVSLSTIHRDLNELKREGWLKKFHGAVMLNELEDIETKINVRLRANIELKQKIAQKALEFVENDDCIFMDDSSTSYYFAQAISKSSIKNLIIITNSYSIPGAFFNNNNIQVVCTGGLLLKEYDCFTGPIAIDALKKFNGDKFFLSAGAITLKDGLSDIFRPEPEEVKKEMSRLCRQKICLVDSTKFGKTGISRTFLLSEIDMIITDSNCSMQTREEFLAAGKALTIA